MRVPTSTALPLCPPPPHVVCVHSPVVKILVTAKSRAWLNFYMWMKMVRLRACIGAALQRQHSAGLVHVGRALFGQTLTQPARLGARALASWSAAEKQGGRSCSVPAASLPIGVTRIWCQGPLPLHCRTHASTALSRRFLRPIPSPLTRPTTKSPLAQVRRKHAA